MDEGLIALVERIARLEEQATSIRGLLAEKDKQVGLALASIERATSKAEDAQLRVNAGQNEFRSALRDQTGLYATKIELAAVAEKAVTMGEGINLRMGNVVEQLGARLNSLEAKAASSSALLEGRDRGAQPLNAIWMILIAAVVAAVAGVITSRVGA